MNNLVANNQLNTQDTATLPDLPSSRPKFIPLEKIIGLRSKGLTHADIAKLLGCSRPAISQRLGGLEDNMNALNAYKEHKADYLAFQQQRMLDSLTADDIKKASAYQRIGMFGILYDKERVERGLLTDIVGYVDLNKALDQVIAARTKLQEELGLTDLDRAELGDTMDDPDDSIIDINQADDSVVDTNDLPMTNM